MTDSRLRPFPHFATGSFRVIVGSQMVTMWDHVAPGFQNDLTSLFQFEPGISRLIEPECRNALQCTGMAIRPGGSTARDAGAFRLRLGLIRARIGVFMRKIVSRSDLCQVDRPLSSAKSQDHAHPAVESYW